MFDEVRGGRRVERAWRVPCRAALFRAVLRFFVYCQQKKINGVQLSSTNARCSVKSSRNREHVKNLRHPHGFTGKLRMTCV